MLPKKKSGVIVYKAEEKLSPGELAQRVRERQECSVQKVTTRAQKKAIERDNRENKPTMASDKPYIKSLHHPIAPKLMKNSKLPAKGVSLFDVDEDGCLHELFGYDENKNGLKRTSITFGRGADRSTFGR